MALGPGATEAAATLGEHGAATVYASDDAVYDDHLAQPAAHALKQLVDEHQPNLILFGLTYPSPRRGRPPAGPHRLDPDE